MFENKVNELRKKADFVDALSYIYDKLSDAYNWDCMTFHAPDEEHDENWFTEKNEDEMSDWEKSRSDAYRAVFDAIEKLAK